MDNGRCCFGRGGDVEGIEASHMGRDYVMTDVSMVSKPLLLNNHCGVSSTMYPVFEVSHLFQSTLRSGLLR